MTIVDQDAILTPAPASTAAHLSASMPRKIRNLRWWIIALLMLGGTINYLTRSTLGVAAPTLIKDLGITTKQYSWIVATFQGALMTQPLPLFIAQYGE